MKQLRLRDMFTEDTYCNYELKGIFDDQIFENTIAEIKDSKYWYWESPDKIGDDKVFSVADWVFVCSEAEKKIKAVMSVYELHGFEVIPEKEVVVVYGHEEIVIYFADGFSKKIATR